MSNIEPTEEHMQAAFDASDKHGWRAVCKIADVARLLAEREAKLREELRGEWSRLVEAREVTAMIVEGHQLRARVAELEGCPQFASVSVDGFIATGDGPVHVDDVGSVQDALTKRVAELEAEVADAVFSCPGCGRHDFGFFASQIKAACGPCRTRAEAAEEREAQHLARIAELEAEVSESTRLRMTETLHGMGVEAMYQEREAQHLADIKALHQFLGDHEEEEGIWIPRSEFKDVPCRKYTAHYDDAKAAEGGEG